MKLCRLDMLRVSVAREPLPTGKGPRPPSAEIRRSPRAPGTVRPGAPCAGAARPRRRGTGRPPRGGADRQPAAGTAGVAVAALRRARADGAVRGAAGARTVRRAPEQCGHGARARRVRRTCFRRSPQPLSGTRIRAARDPATRVPPARWQRRRPHGRIGAPRAPLGRGSDRPRRARSRERRARRVRRAGIAARRAHARGPPERRDPRRARGRAGARADRGSRHADERTRAAGPRHGLDSGDGAAVDAAGRPESVRRQRRCSAPIPG